MYSDPPRVLAAARMGLSFFFKGPFSDDVPYQIPLKKAPKKGPLTKRKARMSCTEESLASQRHTSLDREDVLSSHLRTQSNLHKMQSSDGSRCFKHAKVGFLSILNLGS